MENINVQVYSLISEPISPIEKLKTIAKLGFAGAEFTADFTEVPVEEMKKVLAENNLKVDSAHVGLDQIESVLPYFAELGAKLVICPAIILQNISQIKRMFPDDWESVSGMCDEILYLGGTEQSTHEWISKAMGQETIDNRSYGTTHSWTSGSNSTNEQNSGRALMDVTEVRLKNKLLKGKIGSVIMILADERPIIDEKYDLNRHPRIKLSADGGAPQYSYVSSELLPETNTIQINETDVDEDEVDGVFTFGLQNVELN